MDEVLQVDHEKRSTFFSSFSSLNLKNGKNIPFLNIPNLINFTTSIPNSQLISIDIENFKKKRNSQSISSTDFHKPKENKMFHSTISSMDLDDSNTFENLNELHKTTELPFLIEADEDISEFSRESSNVVSTAKDMLDVNESLKPTVSPSEIEPSSGRNLLVDLTERSDILQTSSFGLNEDGKVGIITSSTQGINIDIDVKHITKILPHSTKNHSFSSVTRSATVVANVNPSDLKNEATTTTIHTSNFPVTKGVTNSYETKVNQTSNKSLTLKSGENGLLGVTKMVDLKNITSAIPSNQSLASTLSASTSDEGNKNSSHIHIFPSKIQHASQNKTHNKTNSFKNTNSGDIGVQVKGSRNIIAGEDPDFINFDLNSSVVLSIGVSFAFALLLFVAVSIWVIRRSKYHSKVYLSYELAKPRTHLTKPLRPSILPGETIMDDMVTEEIESPSEPSYFEQEINVKPTLHSKFSISMESCDSGIDNLAFTDASSSEGQRLCKNPPNKKKDSSKTRRLPPKYMARKKKSAMDNSLRVCSSDGSIFPASPSLTKCLIPPPPYSPTIKIEKLSNSYNKLKDSSSKTPINSISEVCEDHPSQSSNVK